MITLRPTSRKKFVGIGEAAEKLEVTPGHLYRVLIGRRKSDRLLEALNLSPADTEFLRTHYWSKNTPVD
jgi:hypothetical protein